MIDKRLFDVLVRAIGVLVFLHGLASLHLVLAQWIFARYCEHPVAVGTNALNTIYVLLAMALGATMIRWPEWLVRLAWLERLPTIGRMIDEDSSN